MSKYRFNSIKVQLELNQFQNSRGFKTFQFHKGAIRTDSLFQYATDGNVSIP